MTETFTCYACGETHPLDGCTEVEGYSLCPDCLGGGNCGVP